MSVSDTDGIFRDSSLYIVLDGTENLSTQKKPPTFQIPERETNQNSLKHLPTKF